ncbi:MAG: ribonuclease III family protein [Bacteroidia bacterium]
MALRRFFSGSSELSGNLYRITGIRPGRISIYKEALRHSSVNDLDRSPGISDNERLEFLGDAILDAVIAEMLFLRYPYQKEGFLTEMRTRIVNRDQMAYLAERLGLVSIMEIKPEILRNRVAVKTIGSNSLEALIGAIYLDKGYNQAKRFILNRLVGQYLDLDKLMNTTISFKASLLKWTQKHRKVVTWTQDSMEENRQKLHVVSLLIDGEILVTEKNQNRKRAEELCCEKAVRMLEIGG